MRFGAILCRLLSICLILSLKAHAATSDSCEILMAPANGAKVTTRQIRQAQVRLSEDPAGTNARTAFGPGGIAFAVSPKTQSAMALISVQKNPAAVAAALAQLQLTQRERFELAKTIAKSNFEFIVENQGALNLTSEQKVELLQVYAANMDLQDFQPSYVPGGGGYNREQMLLGNGQEFVDLYVKRMLQIGLSDSAKYGAIVSLYSKNKFNIQVDPLAVLRKVDIRDHLVLMTFADHYSYLPSAHEFFIEGRLDKKAVMILLRNQAYRTSILGPVSNWSDFHFTQKERVEIAEGIMRRKDFGNFNQLYDLLRALKLDTSEYRSKYARLKNGLDLLIDLSSEPQSSERDGKIKDLVAQGDLETDKPEWTRHLPRALVRMLTTPHINRQFLVRLWGTRHCNGCLADLSDLTPEEIGKVIEEAGTLPNVNANEVGTRSLSNLTQKQRIAALRSLIKIGYPVINAELYLDIPGRRELAYQAALGARDRTPVTEIVKLSRILEFSYSQKFNLAKIYPKFAEEIGLDTFMPKDRAAIIQVNAQRDEARRPKASDFYELHLNKIDVVLAAVRAGKSFERAKDLEELGIKFSFPMQAERLVLAARPFKYLNGFSNPKVDAATPAADLKKVILHLAQTEPRLVTESEAEWITAIPNNAVMISLLALKAEAELRAQKHLRLQSPMALVALALGIPEERLIKSRFGQVNLPALIAIAADLVSHAAWQKFKKVEIEALLIDNPKNHGKLLAVLNLYRNFLSLNGNAERKAKDPFAKLRSLTAANIEDVSAELKAAVVEAIRQMFRSEDMQFDYADWERLQAEWGDIEPVLTLLARYKGKSEWQKEIPVLGRIFKHSLKRTFERYKFHGDPDDHDDIDRAANQLSPLSAQQIEKLKELRTELSLLKPSAGVKVMGEDEILSTVRPIIDTTVVPNLRRKNLDAQANAVAERRANMARILPRNVVSNNHLAFIEELQRRKEIYPEDKHANGLILHDLVEVLGEARDIAILRFVTKAAIGMIQKNMILNLQGAELAETKADLENLSGWLNPKTTGANERAIIFSTTIHHPKSLLTIGDLTLAGSCQNYRTGGVIQTLPGYVIDANVLALGGYGLTAAQFKTGKEFEMVFGAMDKGLEVDARLDEINKVIHFSWSEAGRQQEILTIPISHAQHRQVLAIGSSDGLGAIYAERPYAVSHFASQAIVDSANALIRGLAKDAGLKLGGKVLRQGSRNALGVYTDAGGGQKNQGSSFTVETPEQ